MRTKALLVLALAVTIAPAAFADVILTFSSPVTMVSFYSSEPTTNPLTATAYGNSVTTVSVASGNGVGAVTSLSGANVTEVDFSGAANHYVLDDLTYMVGNSTYTINFDDPSFNQLDPVGAFYSFMPGAPTFSGNAWILQYPHYNYTDFPYHSSPNVIVEAFFLPPPPPPPPQVPEPGTLVLFGSGLISVAGTIRRKWMA